MLNPGELTRQIIIQKKKIDQDIELNSITSWTDWRGVWAKPLPKDSKEYFKLQTINSEITEVFKIRFIYGVDSRMRIRFKNKCFEIVGEPINEDEKNETLLISCKAVG